MKEVLLAFLSALIIVVVSMPILIKVAKLKHLVDEPGDQRKLHKKSIPTLGGILIFASTVITYCLWFPAQEAWQLGANYNPLQALHEFKFVLASMFILFFIGLKDDIIGLDPLKKLAIHVFVGFVLVVLADIRLSSFWGLFEVNEIPYWLSVAISIFIYRVTVNAINLIDGFDGWAGVIGLIGSLTFTYWFYRSGDLPLALLAVGLSGSLLGFLIFNFHPARVFMGDSGSLIIGLAMYVLAMKMIEYPPSKLSIAMQHVSK
ncbi:MAG: glycosyltransferase family 4 protein, partial [Bacteroidota bacterium]